MPEMQPPSTKKTRRIPGRLQRKLFRYYLILPMMILAVFFFFFYSYVSSLLIQRELSALETQATAIRTDVYNSLYNLNQVSVNINYFNRRTGFLTKDSITTTLLNEYIAALNGTTLKADQINLYNLEGQLAQTGRLTRVTTYDPEGLSWLSPVLADEGLKTISTPYRTKQYSPGSQEQEWYVSVYRAATDSSHRVIGAIETMRRCKNLFSGISDYLRKSDRSSSVYLFNQEGALIYPYDASADRQEELSAYYRLIQSLGTESSFGQVKDPLTGEPSRYILIDSGFSGWSYLFLQEDKVILRPARNMLFVLFCAVLVMLGIAVFFSWVLSRSMVKPVKHLKHVVQRVRLETLGAEHVTDYQVSYEELDELYHEFEKMNHSLKASLQELEHARSLELKSRVLALQTQMNPHFYYNTLSCISVLAENGQTAEVSHLCENLSSMMRYITNTQDILVPMTEAVDYLERYLYCMKIRYEDSLTYEIDFSEDLLSLTVPKLILQPLVENALKHGTDCLPPWHISVRGRQTDRGWEVTVTDSGNGFSEEALKNLSRRFRELDAQGQEADAQLKIGGLGLVNTYIRWKLHCRGDAFFEFGNTPEGHAFTRIGKRTTSLPIPHANA